VISVLMIPVPPMSSTRMMDTALSWLCDQCGLSAIWLYLYYDSRTPWV